MVRLQFLKGDQARVDSSHRNTEGRKVLLLQSATPGSESIVDRLELWRCDTVRAAEIEEAAKYFAEGNRADLVLIDMPGQISEVIEFVSKLKRSPETANLQIALVSSFSERDLIAPECSQLFSNILITPIRRRSLYQTVAHQVTVRDNSPFPAALNRNEELKGLRVLLAEDNFVNQKIAVQVLNKAGCEITVVETGKQALEALETASFEVILMDCQMPVMDGFTATQEIRSSGQPWSSIPIVAVTANAMNGDREKCLEAGMNDYLSKPIKPAKLIEVLTEWTRPGKSQREAA